MVNKADLSISFGGVLNLHESLDLLPATQPAPLPSNANLGWGALKLSICLQAVFLEYLISEIILSAYAHVLKTVLCGNWHSDRYIGYFCRSFCPFSLPALCSIDPHQRLSGKYSSLPQFYWCFTQQFFRLDIIMVNCICLNMPTNTQSQLCN